MHDIENTRPTVESTRLTSGGRDLFEGRYRSIPHHFAVVRDTRQEWLCVDVSQLCDGRPGREGRRGMNSGG